jgi:hypothetical protein
MLGFDPPNSNISPPLEPTNIKPYEFSHTLLAYGFKLLSSGTFKSNEFS